MNKNLLTKIFFAQKKEIDKMLINTIKRKISYQIAILKSRIKEI